jgi:hypothetical protein
VNLHLIAYKINTGNKMISYLYAFVSCFFRLRKKSDSVVTCLSGVCLSGNETASASGMTHAREGDGSNSKQRAGNFDAGNIVGYSLLNKKTLVPSKHTWLIVVHHKTTVAKTPQCAVPVCCVLISLIRRIHKVNKFIILFIFLIWLSIDALPCIIGYNL